MSDQIGPVDESGLDDCLNFYLNLQELRISSQYVVSSGFSVIPVLVFCCSSKVTLNFMPLERVGIWILIVFYYFGWLNFVEAQNLVADSAFYIAIETAFFSLSCLLFCCLATGLKSHSDLFALLRLEKLI